MAVPFTTDMPAPPEELPHEQESTGNKENAPPAVAEHIPKGKKGKQDPKDTVIANDTNVICHPSLTGSLNRKPWEAGGGQGEEGGCGGRKERLATNSCNLSNNGSCSTR
ncbi:hypothetical protein F5887DRAFT_925583 [Amanita rubescens]|nr:hypothetical protein F5887DRAFT_925583 [Amanita rubescens]